MHCSCLERETLKLWCDVIVCAGINDILRSIHCVSFESVEPVLEPFRDKLTYFKNTVWSKYSGAL